MQEIITRNQLHKLCFAFERVGILPGKEQLLLDLRRIAKNNYLLPEGESVEQYLDPMLKYIGDTDTELRDELIYETFCEWIYEKAYVTDDRLRQMLAALLNNDHLMYHIGNDGDSSVFTRSFSALAIVLILTEHRKRAILDADLFTQAKNAAIAYLMQEKDFRGFVPEYGWAHAAAHGADVLEELVQCKESDQTVLQEILDCMKRVLRNGRYMLCHEEDERLARVAHQIFKMHAPFRIQLQTWLENLTDYAVIENPQIQYIARVNTKHFVRSFYFRLMHLGIKDDIITLLTDTEKKLNRFAGK
jgi:hypothetical protein